MRSTTEETAALHALGPLDVAGYLRSSGWSQIERIGDRGQSGRGLLVRARNTRSCYRFAQISPPSPSAWPRH
jgi:hypothetical protein